MAALVHVNDIRTVLHEVSVTVLMARVNDNRTVLHEINVTVLLA